MKQFTLYGPGGEFIDQIQVYGNPDAQPPAGWVETTGQTFDPVGEARKQIKPVTARQMLRALDQMGMLDAIEAFVASQPRLVRIEWERSQEFQRHNATLAAGAVQFGLTPAQVDAVFALAATL